MIDRDTLLKRIESLEKDVNQRDIFIKDLLRKIELLEKETQQTRNLNVSHQKGKVIFMSL